MDGENKISGCTWVNNELINSINQYCAAILDPTDRKGVTSPTAAYQGGIAGIADATVAPGKTGGFTTAGICYALAGAAITPEPAGTATYLVIGDTDGRLVKHPGGGAFYPIVGTLVGTGASQANDVIVIQLMLNVEIYS